MESLSTAESLSTVKNKDIDCKAILTSVYQSDQFYKEISMSIFRRCDIMLPKDTENIDKWAVLACDQFTSKPEYWEAVAEKVGDAPSALNLILPEVYLSGDYEKRVKEINENMKRYIKEDVFRTVKSSMIYVERTTHSGVRHGIVGEIDLSQYEYKPGSKARVRATERTVEERLPIRIEIRRGAPLEVPHILILINDPTLSVIEPCTGEKERYESAYSFDLMLGGGHIDGYIMSEEAIARVESTLERLCEENDFVFAVGDGNHSLAAAKNSGSKTALCEIVNIYDHSLVFEPIYRVLFGMPAEYVLSKAEEFFGTLSYSGDSAQKVIFAHKENRRVLSLPPVKASAVSTVTAFIDKYLSEHSDSAVDYIHGEDEAIRLAGEENACAFLFDVISKNELFDAVEKDGVLVRKAFSMGDAEDKRYYIEAKIIK